ncbi:MAG: N-acetyltransferase family protein [Anaerolineae bacterium]|jgi:GNAT superfamily N-acetyltransferase
MPTIELASCEAGSSILEITAATGIFTPVEVACVEELWNEYRHMGKASDYVFLVYREEGRIVGYACFGPHPLTSGAYDLYWIAVDPFAQHRGIGRALLARVETEVKDRKGYLLLIETSSAPPYAAARHIYESSGYRCEAIIRDFYGRGDHLHIFVKDLEQTFQQGVLALDCVPVLA